MEVAGAVETGVEGEFAGLAGGDADNDDLVGRGTEDFAGVLGSVVGEGRGDDGGVEVEFEAVVF